MHTGSLPPGFSETLDKVQRLGILQEDSDRLHMRLQLAAEGVASVEAARDMGLKDTVADFLRSLKVELHKELCDSETKSLKAEYANLLDYGLTREGIQVVGAAVTSIAVTINPAFAVSSVVLYASVWLLKKGLNNWCGLPPEAVAT